MKIGILTFHSTNNFGAFLHTIALYNKVQELGYDCEIIDYLSPEVIRREKDGFKFVYSPIGVLRYIVTGHVLKSKFSRLHDELRKLTVVGPEYTPATIHHANQRYDTFLVGSDVVWSLRISNNDYNYFLEFAEESKKKISFSSSVGETDRYREDKKLPILLRNFSEIAVREEAAVDWVKEISGKDAFYVCDPTMLYTGKEWEHIIRPQEYISDYVLIYFADSKGKLERDAIHYAQKHNFKVKIINYGRPIKGMTTVRPKSLEEFLGLIKYSKALFTASYHGMLFGLYFEKELFYYNRSLKARIESLAKQFDIEDHNGDLFSDKVRPIDYDKVNPKIEFFRKYSLDVLSRILSI